jgi:hypothetical protein
MKYRFQFASGTTYADHSRFMKTAFGGFTGVTYKWKGTNRVEINGGKNSPEDILAAMYLFAEGTML